MGNFEETQNLKGIYDYNPKKSQVNLYENPTLKRT